MEIANKHVVLTGAADGIGKEMVKIFIEEGCTVYGLDINEVKLMDLQNELGTDKFIPYPIDVRREENIKKFKKWFDKKKGHCDILINNAGIVQPFIKITELDDEMIHRVMSINFFAPMHMCRLFTDDMIKNGTDACIVNVSSMAGFFPFPKQSIYGASKSALKLFTEGLYAELSDTKVNAMTVFPGAIHTNILDNSGVEYKSSKKAKTKKEAEDSYQMTEADDAARQIIQGIEDNKIELYVGSDSKFMHFIYKLSPKKAIKFINKKMG